MKRYIAAAFLLLVPFQSKAGDSQIVYQMETGFKLQPRAAQAILDSVPMKAEKRSDFYADIYNGSGFLLIPSRERYKFRLKSKADKWTMQANTKTSINPRQCPEGSSFTVMEKRVGELLISQKQAAYFETAVKEQLDLFGGNDAAGVARSVRELHNFILGLPVPLLDKMTAVAQGQRWVFTASHLSRKTKWKAPLPGNKNIEISVTLGEDYTGSTFIQNRADVEFQVSEEGVMSVDEFSKEVCSFMRGQGLSSGDMNPELTDAQAVTLGRMAKFRAVILGAARGDGSTE